MSGVTLILSVLFILFIVLAVRLYDLKETVDYYSKRDNTNDIENEIDAIKDYLDIETHKVERPNGFGGFVSYTKMFKREKKKSV